MHVLLIEDDPDDRRLVDEYLSEADRGVSRDDALSQARNHRGPMHLLLTDVVLPSGGGIEVAEQGKSLRPEIAVLYMPGERCPRSARSQTYL